MRLPHDNIESSVMTGLVEGIRGRGRPRVGWLDSIVASTAACRGSACCTLHVTDVAGRQLLIYAANRRSATTPL